MVVLTQPPTLYWNIAVPHLQSQSVPRLQYNCNIDNSTMKIALDQQSTAPRDIFIFNSKIRDWIGFNFIVTG